MLVRCCDSLAKTLTVMNTAVSSEAWAKLCDWASVATRGWLLLSGSVAHASLETAVLTTNPDYNFVSPSNSGLFKFIILSCL